jgi:hypothetical protein
MYLFLELDKKVRNRFKLNYYLITYEFPVYSHLQFRV